MKKMFSVDKASILKRVPARWKWGSSR